ncbi:MAG: lipid biosynthesis acyltransferase [Proteobacteria bacterium]|nr:lipid biosynthesis acyltransferase [Pseudomonadota bacterium]
MLTTLFRFLSRFPLAVLHPLGAVLGRLTYLASPTYRRHLRENLAAALPGSERLRGVAAAQAGRQMLEIPFVWLRPREEVLALAKEVTGWELAEAAHGRGEGILFLTPHLGCFEITAQYIAARMPITVLYRAPKQTWLQPLMEQGRGGGNVKLAAADLGGVRQLMRALRQHQAIGLLPDQVPGRGEGTWADFFGRPAYTMTLAARLSEMPRTAVIFVYAERLSGAQGFRVTFLAPPVAVSGNLGQRVQAINACVEDLIRRCPAQYLWGYNRYKRPSGAEPPDPTESEA